MYPREWACSLSRNSAHHFLRAAQIGVDLAEPWLVCCAASYLWNYSAHALRDHRYAELAETFQALVSALRTTGHDGLVVECFDFVL